LNVYEVPFVKPEIVVERPVVVAVAAPYEEAEASFTYTLYPETGADEVEAAVAQERLAVPSPELASVEAGATGVVIAVAGEVGVDGVAYTTPSLST